MGTASYIWDDSSDMVEIYNTGTPTTIPFSTLRSKDLVGENNGVQGKSHQLHPRAGISEVEWETTDPGNPNYRLPIDSDAEVRALDSIAILLWVRVQNFTVEGDIYITGTDWRGQSQVETVHIAANGDIQTTNRFQTITLMSDDGVVRCEFQIWQDRWGIIGWNPGVPVLTTSWVLQGTVRVYSGITFQPVSIIGTSYCLFMRESACIIVESGGTCTLGRHDGQKACSCGVEIKHTGGLIPFNNVAGTLNLYGVTIDWSSMKYIESGVNATTRVYCAKIMGGGSGFKGYGFDIYNILYTKNDCIINAGDKSFSGTFDKFTSYNLDTSVLFIKNDYATDLEIKGIYSRIHDYVLYCITSDVHTTAVYSFVDCDFDTWTFYWHVYFDGRVYRRNSFNRRILYPDGSPYQYKSWTIKDNTGTVVASGITQESGKLDDPLDVVVTHGYYERANGNTETPYGPFTLWVDGGTDYLDITKTITLDLKDTVGDETMVSVADLVNTMNSVLQIEKGRWKIVDNQLIYYAADGVTPLYTFNLKDRVGNPTEKEVYERVPVP